MAGVPNEVIAEDYARTADAAARAMLNTLRRLHITYRTAEDCPWSPGA